jgi:penicillin-binding protein 1A
MSGTGQQFPRVEHVQRDDPKPRSQFREAFSQIGAGIRQLFTAMAIQRPGLWSRCAKLGRAAGMLCKIGLVGTVVISLALATAMLWVLYDVPVGRQTVAERPSLLVEAADGQPLGRVGPLGDAVASQDFPEILVKAVISIEDRRFYRHLGLDLRGIARATFANWTAGKVVEGGSTITQQLAKMQIVGPERSMGRKLREAFIATWLELRLPKHEILTRYLNNVYLGAGAHGMSAAARMYFDKNVADLTLPEAALLAGLIQAPSKYNPIRNLEAAHQRAATVIDAMVEAGTIDETAARKAKAEPATLKLSPRTSPAGSWFADWIAKYEIPKIAGAAKRPLRVRTTLQPEVQQLAERVVREALERPDEARGAGQAALVAMRPDGSVVAMVGGRDYEESQFNRAVDAQRQPGSAFKLFVYYAALRNGYGLETSLDASPVEMDGWRPKNYSGREFTRMPLWQSFAQSVNSAAIRLGGSVGLDEVVAAARELGLDAPLTKVPSMALGTNEVSLLDITGAFASVRAARPKLEPWGIAAFGPEGAGPRSLGPPAAAAQELPHQAAMLRLLHDVVDRGTGRAAALDEGRAAGKTGTSQDYRDAWFVGFNDELVVGVWVGNDDRSAMEGVTGGSLPALIWKRFVSAATPLIGREPVAAEAKPASAGETAAPATAALSCDPAACAAEHPTFRASDCTYQPAENEPRRTCTKTVAGEASPSLERASMTSAGALCDRDRCARRYRSFDPATCTYKSYDGGRKLCDLEADDDD